MSSSTDENWSLEIYPSIPSMEDMNALSEKVMSGLNEALVALNEALSEFDEALSDLGSASDNRKTKRQVDSIK
jgi:hypothetical protein